MKIKRSIISLVLALLATLSVGVSAVMAADPFTDPPDTLPVDSYAPVEVMSGEVVSVAAELSTVVEEPAVTPTPEPEIDPNEGTISVEIIYPGGGIPFSDGGYTYQIDIEIVEQVEETSVENPWRHSNVLFDQIYYSVDVPPGTYQVCGYPFDLYNQIWTISVCHDDVNGLRNATDVVVGSGENVTVTIDLDFEVGTIAGIVTDENNNPLKGSQIIAMVVDDTESVHLATTDDDGSFALTVPANETYIVQFLGGNGNVDPAFRETYGELPFVNFFAETPSPDSYTPVEVGSGEVVSVTATLPDNPNAGAYSGAITGTVTNEEGEPLPNIEVSIGENRLVLEPELVKYTRSAFYDVVTTDENGQFNLQNMPDGSYRVYFIDPTERYFDLPYNENGASDTSQSSFSSLFSQVFVTNGATVQNINGSLTPVPVVVTGQVAGRVGLGSITNTSESVLVALWHSDPTVTGHTRAYSLDDYTDADGNYLITDVPVGEYFLSAGILDDDYRPKFYEDGRYEGRQYGGEQVLDATPIIVSEGEVTVVDDFVLDRVEQSIWPTVTITSPINFDSESVVVNRDLWSSEIQINFLENIFTYSDDASADSRNRVTLTYNSMCPETTTAATLTLTPFQNDLDVTEIEMTPNYDGTLNGTLLLGDVTWGGTITIDDLGGYGWDFITLEWECGDEIITQSVGTAYEPLPTAVTLTQIGGTAASTGTIALVIPLIILTAYIEFGHRKCERM